MKRDGRELAHVLLEANLSLTGVNQPIYWRSTKESLRDSYPEFPREWEDSCPFHGSDSD
ncbi:hypothetical protein ACET3Z_010157 [Daucus carota]